jgi:hypothetical protein
MLPVHYRVEKYTSNIIKSIHLDGYISLTNQSELFGAQKGNFPSCSHLSFGHALLGLVRVGGLRDVLDPLAPLRGGARQQLIYLNPAIFR